MKYELVIFDWDGTLMDSAAKIINCMQRAAAQAKLRIPSAKEVEEIIGISLKPAIKRLFSMDDDDLAEEMVHLYRQHYMQFDTTPMPLFDGVNSLLAMLSEQQRYLAVATGKARLGLEQAWQLTATGHYFNTSRCADEAQSKPSPDMLLQILEQLNMQPQQAVMIGDSIYDMQMAEAIGMDRIAVSYGVHSEAQLRQHQPVAVVDHVAALNQYL